MKVVLVVGPPRSGTSTTARILHEKLGVCMGHNLVLGNAGNPEGFYEDSKYVDLIRGQYHYLLRDALSHGCAIVGVKSPELCKMSIEHLWPDKIIRTHRPFNRIVASTIAWRQPRPTQDEAVQIVKDYETQIDEALSTFPPWKVWDIFYPGSEYRSDHDIEMELRHALAM